MKFAARDRPQLIAARRPLMRGRGLKFDAEMVCDALYRRPLMRGRGLKFDGQVRADLLGERRPLMRGRGLKFPALVPVNEEAVAPS